MKTLIQSLLASSTLLCLGAVAHAQSYANYAPDDIMVVRQAPRQSQLVKFYKPTQAYYGKGYVIRYGYKATTPEAAGYIYADARMRVSADMYLPADTELRRDVITQGRVAVPVPTSTSTTRTTTTTTTRAPALQEQPKPEQKREPETKVQKPN